MRRPLIALYSGLALAAMAGSAAAQAQPQDPPAQEMNQNPNQEMNAPPPTAQAPQIQPAPAQMNACPPGTTTAYQPAPAAPARRETFSPDQVSISVGGGVADFVRDRYSKVSGVSGAWDARAMFGTRSVVSFEAGYLGTVGSAQDTIVAQGHLATTQVYGDLRLNGGMRRVQPFIDAGVGWANLHRTGATAAELLPGAVFSHNSNGVVVPMGAGLAGYIGKNATLDARFDYRLIPQKGFVDLGARPDMWVAELRLGYAF